MIMIEPVPFRETQTIPLSKMVINSDCLTWMRNQPTDFVDHIITDPPYGIDMAMLNQQNPHGGMVDISRIEETHQVEPNLQLLSDFFPEAFRLTRPRGFCILWCDIMNWQFLYDNAIKVGFKVQRWPLIWHKTSACMNQSAQFNFTKNYEIAMVCRKSSSTLLQPMPSSIFPCARAATLSNPFAKPSELWVWLINAVSQIGQTILDPFAGEGSCPYACLSVSRLPIGVEIDEKHYNVMLDTTKRFCDILFRKPIYT
jgi:site-specific DNA-methyltransferase (adenine-specific)